MKKPFGSKIPEARREQSPARIFRETRSIATLRDSKNPATRRGFSSILFAFNRNALRLHNSRRPARAEPGAYFSRDALNRNAAGLEKILSDPGVDFLDFCLRSQISSANSKNCLRSI
jgi:hypothetical protein